MLNLNEFMKKYFGKNNTMNENEKQRVFHYHIYPRVSKIHSDKTYVNIDNGQMGGTYWTCLS